MMFEAYAESHKDELTAFNKAYRTLKKHGGDLNVDLKALQKEYDDLKISHTIACHLAAPRKSPLKTRKRRTSYLPSVSLAALIAWMVASTIFNSFSSSEFSIASIRFLHSLPLFLDG